LEILLEKKGLSTLDASNHMKAALKRSLKALTSASKVFNKTRTASSASKA
jgi:hypothetical protein